MWNLKGVSWQDKILVSSNLSLQSDWIWGHSFRTERSPDFNLFQCQGSSKIISSVPVLQIRIYNISLHLELLKILKQLLCLFRGNQCKAMITGCFCIHLMLWVTCKQSRKPAVWSVTCYLCVLYCNLVNSGIRYQLSAGLLLVTGMGSGIWQGIQQCISWPSVCTTWSECMMPHRDELTRLFGTSLYMCCSGHSEPIKAFTFPSKALQ